MNCPDWRSHRQSGGFSLFLLLVFGVATSCNEPRHTSSPRTVSTPVENPIEQFFHSAAPKEYRDGVAAIVLIDTSGSMVDKVKDASGVRQPKIEIAQRAAIKLVDQFEQYAREHSERPIILGIYEFSDREGEASTRAIIPPGPPDASRAQNAIRQMRGRGGTPIGNAMIRAKLDIDSTGMSKRHIVVITDGANTKGYSPGDVTRAITNQSENDRASIYFVAFDIASSKFDSVRDAGGSVLSASDESELRGTLDFLLTGKILAEQPPQR